MLGEFKGLSDAKIAEMLECTGSLCPGRVRAGPQRPAYLAKQRAPPKAFWDDQEHGLQRRRERAPPKAFWDDQEHGLQRRR